MDVIMIEEWIGLKVKIISSSNSNDVGIEGEIVNETLRTISVLNSNNVRKMVQKKGACAWVLDSNKILELDKAIFRPEDRTKKLYKKVVS